MNRRPRIAVIAFGQAPVGLIYELEKRGVEVTKGEVADAEELVDDQDPHLIALSGIRGAMELSTLLEDQDRTTSPRVAVIAARRDLSRLWGLNRDVVISLLATEMGDKVVAGRLDALARQAAKKRGEALEPAAGSQVSMEPRLPIDAQTTMAPQAVAAIQLVKQAQKLERPSLDVSGPDTKPRGPGDVAELDSDLLESDRPPHPEAPLPSVLMTKLGIGLPDDLRAIAAQKGRALAAPPAGEADKQQARAGADPEPPSTRDSTWDMEVTSQYESVTARPPQEKQEELESLAKEGALPGSGAGSPSAQAPLGDAGARPPSSPTASEPFAAHKSSPTASGPDATDARADEAEPKTTSPELALEGLELGAAGPKGSIPTSAAEHSLSADTTETLESLPPGDFTSDAPPAAVDAAGAAGGISPSALAEMLPEKRAGGGGPRTSAAPPTSKGMSPLAGIILVLMGGLGAAYLISTAAAPRQKPPEAEPPSPSSDAQASAETASQAEPPGSAPTPAEKPSRKKPAKEAASEGKPAQPKPAKDRAEPAEPSGLAEVEKKPSAGSASPASSSPNLVMGREPSPASAADLARALTIKPVKTQTCADLVPSPPAIGPDPAAQASPPWNAARKAIVKGDLVAAKTGMCEAALINPASPALEALALLFVTEDAPTQALIWLDKADAIRPGVRETQDLRAVALTQLGRLDEARAVWFRALNLSPDDTARRQGNAIEDINVAKQHLKRGDLPRAERLLRRAVAFAPDNSLGLAALAEVFLRKKSYDEATVLAEAAIARESYLPDAYVTLAEVARAQGNVEKARKDLERALKIRPDFWAAKKLLQDLDKTGP